MTEKKICANCIRYSISRGTCLTSGLKVNGWQTCKYWGGHNIYTSTSWQKEMIKKAFRPIYPKYDYNDKYKEVKKELIHDHSTLNCSEYPINKPSQSTFIEHSITNHFKKIEGYLQDLKQKEAPELTDEEFAKAFVIEHHFDDNNPYSIVRLKTVEEILNEPKKGDDNND